VSLTSQEAASTMATPLTKISMQCNMDVHI